MVFAASGQCFLAVMILTLSPNYDNLQETLSTLRFGSRAMNVQNKPKVNKELSVEELKSLLEKAHQRINELEMALQNGGSNVPMVPVQQ